MAEKRRAESDIIDLFGPSRQTGDLIKGIGDDAAIFGGDDGRQWIITVDQSIEDVHFRRGRTPAYLTGRKLVSVNVSDILAMGGIPRFFLLALALTGETSEKFITGFRDGIINAADEHGAQIIGGDTSRNPGGFLASLIMIGEPAGSRIIYRKGAEPGDDIYVTGIPGMSARGLALLEAGESPVSDSEREAVDAHVDPAPPRKLVNPDFCSFPTAMIDISDGLAADMMNICRAGGTGAEIDESLLPSAEALGTESRDKRLEYILYGGEDYQLLFTVPGSKRDAFEKFSKGRDCRITRIGSVTMESGLRLKTIDGSVEPLESRGYDHFRHS